MNGFFKTRWRVVAAALGFGAAWLACAQIPSGGVGKNFMYPDYYPVTIGVARKRSVVTAPEYQLLTNNVALLSQPRIEFYRQDGTNLEWTAIARAAEVDLTSREVTGSTNVFFRTADDKLFMTGVGFLWQHTNSLLILSNKTFTWMEVRTNSPSKNLNMKMKPLLATSLVLTAHLTAAEMEVPPARPGLTITAGLNILDLKSNEVLYSNNVLVTYPPAKPGDPTTYLKCVWLTGKRGTNGQVEEIVAHEKVALDRGEQHARGNYAIYTATNEMLSLVGAFDPAEPSHPLPYIYSEQGTNQGKAIIYDRRRGVLTTLEAITDLRAETLKSITSTNVAPTNAVDRPKNPPPAK